MIGEYEAKAMQMIAQGVGLETPKKYTFVVDYMGDKMVAGAIVAKSKDEAREKLDNRMEVTINEKVRF